MRTHFEYYYSEDPEDYQEVENYICGSKCPEERQETNRWEFVTCKKCLNGKESIMLGIEEQENFICNQYGDMADFIKKETEIFSQD